MPARQSYQADMKVIEANRKALLVALGRLFHSHRVAPQLSQQQVAAGIGQVTASACSAVENGIVKDPQRVEFIGAFLDVKRKNIDVYKALIA